MHLPLYYNYKETFTASKCSNTEHNSASTYLQEYLLQVVPKKINFHVCDNLNCSSWKRFR